MNNEYSLDHTHHSIICIPPCRHPAIPHRPTYKIFLFFTDPQAPTCRQPPIPLRPTDIQFFFTPARSPGPNTNYCPSSSFLQAKGAILVSRMLWQDIHRWCCTWLHSVARCLPNLNIIWLLQCRMSLIGLARALVCAYTRHCCLFVFGVQECKAEHSQKQSHCFVSQLLRPWWQIKLPMHHTPAMIHALLRARALLYISSDHGDCPVSPHHRGCPCLSP